MRDEDKLSQVGNRDRDGVGELTASAALQRQTNEQRRRASMPRRITQSSQAP